MKTRLLLSAFLVLVFTIISFGITKPYSVKKNIMNRDLVITNLMNGINSENQGLKMSSSYFLGELKSEEAVIPLMKILKSDENEEARIMAALSLVKIGDARGLFAIKQAVKFDNSERVKKMCSIFYQDYLSKK
ncbi:MAG: HEAT repeat domain-containing protein [Ignavibacteria bacterium]|nr:HEAT repeat domain-containing protein [Ignavibacteria bacterium]